MLLAELATQAIADGYFRESIASFSAALERFYETCTQSIWIDQGVSDEAIATAWKPVLNSSERQMGAFLGAYVGAFKKVPVLLSDKDVKRRNDVIHKGRMPSCDDAVRFGESCMNVMRPIYPEMQTLPNAGYFNYRAKLNSEAQSQAKESDRIPGFGVRSYGFPTIFDNPDKSVAERVNEIRQQRIDMFGSGGSRAPEHVPV